MTPATPTIAREWPGGVSYRATIDADGVLAITIAGTWSTDQVDDFFMALLPIYHQARQRHGQVRALIRVEAVQSPTVAMHVRARTLALKMVGDRNAFVVATFLAKLQISRLATTENFGVFTDAAAARTWLTGG